MFFYSKQKFHANGICFAIPDNFFLHSLTELEKATNIEIEAADQSYTVTIGIDEGCDGTAQELQTMISEVGGMTPLCKITPVTVAGFAGHFLKYRSSREEYYEMRLTLGGNVEFYLYITTQSRSIDDVISSDAMVWMMQQIERSEL